MSSSRLLPRALVEISRIWQITHHDPELHHPDTVAHDVSDVQYRIEVTILALGVGFV